MKEVQGRLFQDEIDSNSKGLKDYAEMLGQAHRTLHEKEIAEELFELSRCKDFMRSFFERNKIFSVEVNHWLIELLDGLSSKLSLLHSDFMPYNIMIESGKLKIIDWAEPSLGPAVLDVARTVNFIVDPTDYPESIMTCESGEFVETYLRSYYSKSKIEKDELHHALLINAALEVAWAEQSGKMDSYSMNLKSWIIRNYETNGCEYIKEIEAL